MQLIVYTDGGARGNPGPAGAGVVIQKDGATVAEVKRYLGPRQTNNFAEYEAVVIALQELKRLGYVENIVFRLDSQLVVEQLKGNWKIKEPSLREQATKVRALLANFRNVEFAHVRREQNKEADRLVNEVLDEAGA